MSTLLNILMQDTEHLREVRSETIRYEPRQCLPPTPIYGEETEIDQRDFVEEAVHIARLMGMEPDAGKHMLLTLRLAQCVDDAMDDAREQGRLQALHGGVA